MRHSFWTTIWNIIYRCLSVQDCLSDHPRLSVGSSNTYQEIQDYLSDNPRLSFRSSKTVCKIIQDSLSVRSSKTTCHTIQDCMYYNPRVCVREYKTVCHIIQDYLSDNPRQFFRSSKTVCQTIQDCLGSDTVFNLSDIVLFSKQVIDLGASCALPDVSLVQITGLRNSRPRSRGLELNSSVTPVPRLASHAPSNQMFDITRFSL